MQAVAQRDGRISLAAMAAQFSPVVEFLPFRCERIPLPIYLIEAGAFVGV
jgi:hypothetical protein